MRTSMLLLLALSAGTAAVACSEDKPRRHNGSDAGEGGEDSSGGTAGSSHTSGATSGARGGTTSDGGTAGSSNAGASNAGTGNTPGAGAAGGTDTAGTGTGAAGSGAETSAGGDGSGGDVTPGAGGADGGTGALAGTGGDGGTGGVTFPMDGVPLVEIVLDGSSSMFEGYGWQQASEALITSGELDDHDDLDIGFQIYQGAPGPVRATSETDPACATLTRVAPARTNAAGIEAAMIAVANTYTVETKWETPTGFAVRDATATLTAIEGSESRPKYLLIITDGEPNTCLTLDPQCGQDNVLKAVQDARALGIKTLILGVGDIVLGVSSCEASQSRCGDDHLQDVANAGAGQPVAPPPEVYSQIGCHFEFDNMLQATYADAGGTARFYSSENEGGATAELAAALQAITDGTVP